MLKLIYSHSLKGITLKFHKKERTFNKRLIYALVIALSLHILFFLSFKVNYQSIKTSVFLLPHQVATDFKKNDISVVGNRISQLDFTLLSRADESYKKENPVERLLAYNLTDYLEPDSFSEMLDFKRVSYEIQQDAPLDCQTFIDPISISSNNTNLILPQFKKKRMLIGSYESVKANLELLIENKTGRVFDVKVLGSSNKEYDQKMKKVGFSIRAKPKADGFSSTAIIEVSMQIDKEELK